MKKLRKGRGYSILEGTRERKGKNTGREKKWCICAEDETCLSVYEPVFSDISRAFSMSDQLCN